jgi:geranylgeranyl diphosphate synthase type II
MTVYTTNAIYTSQKVPMEPAKRIEQSLGTILAQTAAPEAPPGLLAAVRHSVFPAGARVRPRLCLAVARACGEDDPVATDAAAAAIELLHCASLVHDDLPCFDDAATRRGRPSVHVLYGERLAVLAGDALIVLAFQALAQAGARHPERLPPLLTTIGRCVGMPGGIVAGQAWECETTVVLRDYQRAKTGSLFAAAAVAGATTAGADPAAWRAFGEWLGEAYQVADDIRDVAGNAHEIGKPVGRDAALGRPSAVQELGLGGAVNRVRYLVANAIEAVPPCRGAEGLHDLIRSEARRLVPVELALRVA